MSKTASFWLGLGLAASIGAPAGAQQPAAPQPDTARVRELVQQALQQAQPQSQSPAAAPAEIFTTAGPRVNLSIEEAVQRGAEKNIDIAVARITPQPVSYTHLTLPTIYSV